MDDVNNSWLEQIILKVLPATTNDQIGLIISTFTQLGIETPHDLAFLTEKDLVDVLPIIKARKLLLGLKGEGTAQTNYAEQTTLCNDEPPSTSDSHGTSHLTETPGGASVGDWSMKYKIPWDKLPNKLMASCTKGERPDPRDRREMIRIIADDVMQISTNPKRKELRRIAQQVVKRFNKSFADVINGQIIGDGSSSLLLQLESRKENLLRHSHEHKKRKDKDTSDETSSEKKTKTKELDGFGCIKAQWKPNLPEGETEETQEVKRKALSEIYEEVTWKRVEIDEMMAATYCTQRKDIMKAGSIEDFLEQWPFLAEERWLFSHFNTLTGIDLVDKLKNYITDKSSRLLNFLKTKKSPATLVKAIREIQHGTSKAEIFRNVPKLLATYFKEDETALIRHYDENTTNEAVERDDELPATPCVAVIGELQKLFVCIDKKIVTVGLSSLTHGMMMAFAAFYVFNIEYPASASSTLDFIQRLFVGINPPSGSRASKGRKQCGYVGTKVLNLAQELAMYESDWQSEP